MAWLNNAGLMAHRVLPAAALKAMAVILVVLAGCSAATSSTRPSHPPASPVAAVPVPGPALGPRTKTAGCTAHGGLPDPDCTPGAIDPRVTQATLTTTICDRGYTATVRPPSSVTDKIKRDQMVAYGLQNQRLGEYELDHLVGLEVGGAPADVANLWPQPWTGDGNAHMKDAVETYLNREVCRGVIPLAEAQRQIATDWLAVYRSRGLSPTP